MLSSPTHVYALSLLLLFVKFFATITVQALERLRHRRFRYAEDARQWHGTQGKDSDVCIRAQRVLRNDAESQPWFVALGGLYLWLGAWPTGAPYYFGLYALSRCLHAYFLIAARQPHRNRAFSVGVAILFALSAHVLYEVLAQR